MEKLELPKVGEVYDFFDDGKRSLSRHYRATVKRIISVEEAKSLKFKYFRADFYHNDETKDWEKEEWSLYDIYKIEQEEHDWIFGGVETECFVECAIPDYDDDMIYFAQTKYDGWFSLDVTNSWQGGRLMLDSTVYDNLIKEYGKEWSKYES